MSRAKGKVLSQPRTSNRFSSVDDERESRHFSASVVAAAAPLGDADNAEAEAPGGGGAGSRGAAR